MCVRVCVVNEQESCECLRFKKTGNKSSCSKRPNKGKVKNKTPHAASVQSRLRALAASATSHSTY